jgi:putative transposase
MRKSQFSHTQIANILKEFEQGKSAEEIQREYRVRKPLFINVGNVMVVC